MHRLFSLNIDTNNCIDVDYNYALGHIVGQGQISPDRRFNFIHIPKNASSEIKQVLPNWNFSNYFQIENPVQHLVILRDPIERWISGITEFLIGNFSHTGLYNSDISIEEIEEAINTKMFQNLLFDFVIFDAHTIPQCWYLRGLNLDNITFFYFDKSVFPRILQYLGIESTVKITNSSLTNPKKLSIIKKLKSLLSDNKKLQHKIDMHYYADHQLFDKIKFHY